MKKQFRDGCCQVCGVDLDLATGTRTNVCYDHDPVLQQWTIDLKGNFISRKNKQPTTE